MTRHTLASAGMAITFTPEARRKEPPATDSHFHVLVDTGGPAFLLQPPRFSTRQGARQAALRRMAAGVFEVKPCKLPCRFETPRPRRKRKPCRHCGRPR